MKMKLIKILLRGQVRRVSMAMKSTLMRNKIKHILTKCVKSCLVVLVKVVEEAKIFKEVQTIMN